MALRALGALVGAVKAHIGRSYAQRPQNRAHIKTLIPPQCDFRSQQSVCQFTSRNAYRNQIANCFGLDLESGCGLPARISEESQGDI